MSKITIIGGDLIEKIGGSYKIFAKEGYEISSEKQVIFDAQEGILYGNPGVFPLPEVNAKCIVHFRPQNEWRGEFEFCWFREKNKEISDSENYSKLIGKYYQFTDSELLETEEEKFNKVINKFYTDADIIAHRFPEKKSATSYIRFYINDDNKWYKNRQKVKIASEVKTNQYETFVTEVVHNFKKDPQYLEINNSLQKFINQYSEFIYYKIIKIDKKSKEPILESVVYNGSFLALFPKTEKYGRSEAIIDLDITFLENEKPDYFIFKINNQEVKSDNPFIGIERIVNGKSEKDQNFNTSTKIVKPKEKESIKISCKTAVDFTENKKIEIYSVKIQQDKSEPEILAGCITMIAPVIRNLNVTMIGVKTKISEISEKTEYGRAVDNWIPFFKNSLGQALIKVNIIEKQNKQQITIDVSATTNFASTYSVTSEGTINNTDGLKDLLNTKFEEEYPTLTQCNFRLFFLDVASGVSGEEGGKLLGYSSYGWSSGLMFVGHTSATIAHECLHAMNLPHSFFHRETSYVFKAMETNNIMDYSHLKVDPVLKTERKSKERYYTWMWQWEIVRGYKLIT